ncbi:hypothetical protein METSCH_B07970 [Metschnikowia aff. pulcherrima]|uniref:Uncharacterized protein n=1 Tax=Metschnikowia aff. pulcherrima TaxID=2163413 RepID=A0A4P6XK61_9ASCO|nr:hypothetical protein METSCH_B07970 [Metschnikowia aff. pulcherrima]
MQRREQNTRNPPLALPSALLSENELIAIYMKEVGPKKHHIYATTHVLDTVGDALRCSEPEELERGLNLIAHMGSGGLQLEYGDLQVPPDRTNPHPKVPLEVCDVTSVDTLGRFHDADDESDFDAASLMDCGDALFANIDLPISGAKGSHFSLYKLLDAILSRHVDISLQLQATLVRLERLREQNRHDAVFLRKLGARNELMRERVHELKADVLGVFHEIEILKNTNAEKSVCPETTISYKFPLKKWLDRVVELGAPVLSITEEFQVFDEIPTGPEIDAANSTPNSVPQIDIVCEKQKTKSTPNGTMATRHHTATTNTKPELGAGEAHKTSSNGCKSPQKQLNKHVLNKSAGVPVLLVLLLGCWYALGWNSKIMEGK